MMFDWTALDYKKIISKDALFWGDGRLTEIVGAQNQEKFCNMELYEWISGLYWGEGVAVKYASKMMELATSDENRESWKEVYREEFKHQTIVGRWLLDQGLEPLPMNGLLGHCLDLINSLSQEMNNSEVIKVIESTQLYFEELIHFFVKTRLNKIIDRDLQAILYLILKEEAVHITKGKKEIKLRDGFPPVKAELLKKHINKVFPKFFVKDHLDSKTYEKVSSISTVVAEDFIEKGLRNEDVYTPISIISEFMKIPGYNCSATSPVRGDSMHIYPKGDQNSVYDEIIFPKRYEGFNTFVHGGATAMALDEIMISAILYKHNLMALTKELESIKYLRPIYVEKKYTLEANVITSEKNIFQVTGSIKDAETRKICAAAKGTFYVPTKTQAKRIFHEMAESVALKDRFLSA